MRRALLLGAAVSRRFHVHAHRKLGMREHPASFSFL